MIPLLLAGGSLLSGGMNAWGDYSASKERERSLKANARMTRAAGKQEEKAAQLRANILSEQGREESSMFFNEMSNRGIEIEGSPLLVLTKQFADQLEDRNEGYRQGAIARIAGENKARMLEYQAAQERHGRKLQLFGNVLKTGASAVGAYAMAGGSFSWLSGGKDALAGA